MAGVLFLEASLSNTRGYSFLVGLAALVVAADQYTKYLVRTHIPYGQDWPIVPALAPYINLTYWTNTGAAFGMFQSGSTVFAVIAVVVSVAILYYYRQIPPGNWAVRTALGLQLGGAVGNLIDRVTVGTVTDFIHVTGFPVFNLADSSISVGVAILALSLLLEKRAADKAQIPPGDGAPDTRASDTPPA